MSAQLRAQYRLAPFKDRLFDYPGMLAGKPQDAFVIVDYDKRRDIHRRDKVLRRRVHGEYVSMKPRSTQEDRQRSPPMAARSPTCVGNAAGRQVDRDLHSRSGR
ncbi:MAG: hypothetical protein HPM95_08640 [Alphaproteobacteria bacterium]|nr:hypothetical protein [Alphaproteobacteria bacterium]